MKTDPVLNASVVEAMTIKETSFFRDVRPFDLLRDKVIPKLIEARRDERRLWMWSAACSTGQEAYSLVMLILENFPQLAGWDWKVVATDISQMACEYGRRASFRRIEVDRGLTPHLLAKYFEREGEEWVAKAELRKRVHFRRMDLREAEGWLPSFDVVLLRNVLLYMSDAERTQVLGLAHRRLRGDGALLLGAAEQAEDSCDLFRVELERDTYYYRPAAMR